MKTVIDAFRQKGRSFLTTPEHVELTDDSLIDISHECLMRVWTRLQGWIDAESSSAGSKTRLACGGGCVATGRASGLLHCIPAAESKPL